MYDERSYHYLKKKLKKKILSLCTSQNIVLRFLLSLENIEINVLIPPVVAVMVVRQPIPFRNLQI